ncbi:LamG-like jellyroll fold domain-containing protein [Zobellia sp. 1_MG-2023]|uniref:LamG-like jellyroll fold domain-containing protein n=1 Tax=Zobellia sp. 1_MG-2023 TaxID=3062626 RepID=UPI0026E163BC|nr:LamG-like jellyroll fold domain-containing protein [Zobellia sp. 1_MG-2023]MDO6818430.1 LamG-like jellyroll fold domain-containing protein [Zobellia sp. 1_MG-2023]
MTSFIDYFKSKPLYKQNFLLVRIVLLVMLLSCTGASVFAQKTNFSVMEVVEIEFNSQQQYSNPYMEVDVWVELKKEGSAGEAYRIPVFWDGGNVFRGRLVATSPGNWSWKVLDETVTKSDRGFMGKSGTFSASIADVSSNPNNRGFIRVAPNKRTLEYADGTPFFFTADTSWSALTAVFGFDRANDISGISFKDYISARKKQGFNGLNVIASFPDDTYLEQLGRNLDRPGKERGLWASETWGEKIAPNGETPFELKTRGQSITDKLPEADYQKIDPKYWQSVDQRMQFLSEQGFVTLFESIRRHERWPFRSQVEKNAFYNYIRYLWARYGCYNMIFSWVHHDTNSGNVYPEWLKLVKHANSELNKKIGGYKMPYGQPRTAMSYNTTLKNWERDIPTALDIQNVSNAERDETMHSWLRDIYHGRTTKPALNLEPFYPGWGLHSMNEINPGMDDTSMAQMQMYGSVLSGGLAGHAWGDAWYAGAASSTSRSGGATVVPVNEPQVSALNAFESQSMGHLKDFILDKGHDYSQLVPAADTHLSDSQDYLHTLSVSKDKSFALGFFTADSRKNAKALPTLKNLQPSKTYQFQWWDVNNGGWISSENITTNGSGAMKTPAVPNNDRTKGWAYRIRTENLVDEDDVDTDKTDTDTDTDTDSDINFALRINSGGQATTYKGDTFLADTYYDEGFTLNRPQTGLDDPFKKFRFSRSQVMSYNIPLKNGDYTVKLHFAELWFGATGGGSGGVGKRVFDVNLEGVLVEDNLDVFAQVGAETVLTKAYTVNVSDGQLEIDFSSLLLDGGVRHPIINAIEILGTQEEVEVPPVADSEDESIPDLVGHWPLDELNGVSAGDTSGLGRTGVLQDGLTFDKDKVSGQIEGALWFDGSDDHIRLPNLDDNLQEGFSVSAWVNPSNAEGSYQGIVGSTTSGGFMMFVNRGKLGFKVTTQENRRKLISKGIIKNDVWQMVTCTYDGSDMRWYINGENVHSEALSGTLKDRNVAWIGWSGWGKEYFKGGIDAVRLFSTALTKQQVLSLFEEESAATGSGDLASKSDVSMDNNMRTRVTQPAYVHPNPTIGSFRITGIVEGEKDIVVADFSGHVLLSLKTDDAEPELDLSAYPDAIYIVKVLQNELEWSFKIIKE